MVMPRKYCQQEVEELSKPVYLGEREIQLRIKIYFDIINQKPANVLISKIYIYLKGELNINGHKIVPYEKYYITYQVGKG